MLIMECYKFKTNKMIEAIKILIISLIYKGL